MSRSGEHMPSYLGRAALAPETLVAGEELLALHWDPDGSLRRAMAVRPTMPDPTRPRTLADAGREACGVLAAGGPEADVSGYLRREEVALLAPPEDEAEQIERRERRQRAAIVLWRLVRGISLPSDWEEGSKPQAI